jgi:hypothetical protein
MARSLEPVALRGAKPNLRPLTHIGLRLGQRPAFGYFTAVYLVNQIWLSSIGRTGAAGSFPCREARARAARWARGFFGSYFCRARALVRYSRELTVLSEISEHRVR